MERKRNYIEKVQDWADDCLRRMCGRITPGKRLAVILVMFLFSAACLSTSPFHQSTISGNGTAGGCK